MSQLEHHVAVVRSRHAVTRALAAMAWALVAVAALAVVAILVDRLLLFRPGAPRYRFLFERPGVALLAAIGVAALASVAWGLRRRPSARDAAAQIDETLGTHEAFSTALYLRDRPELANDPFTQAMLRQALVAADKTSVAGRFPIKVPQTLWIAAAVALLAFGLSYLRGYDLFRTAEKAQLARVKVEQEAAARKELTDALAEINAAPAAVQASADVQAAKQQVDEMLQAASMRDPAAASRTAAKAQQAVSDTKDTQQRLANVQNFAKAQANRAKLEKLPDSADKSTLAEATRAIKNGDFGAAIDKVGQLAKEFERMDPADQKKAAEEMSALSQSLKDAINNDSELKDLAKKMQDSGVTADDAKKLQDLTQKAAQGDPQAQQQAQDMAQKLMQQAGATPQQQQAVQNLAQQMQGAQNSQAMMQQLQQATQQMAGAMQQQANAGQQQGAPGQQSPTMQPSPQQANAGQQPAGQSPITPPGIQTPSVGPTIQSPISPLQQTAQSGAQTGGQQQANASPSGAQGGQQASGQQGGQQGGQQSGQQPGGQQSANAQQPGGQQSGQQPGQQPGGQQQGSQQAGANPGGQQPGGQQPGGQQPGSQGGQQPGQSVAQSAKDMQDQLDAIKKDMQQMQAAQQAGQQKGQQQNSQQANGQQGGSKGGQSQNGGQQGGQQGGQGQQGNQGQQAGAGQAGGGNAQGGQGGQARGGQGGGGNQANGGGGQPGQGQGQGPQQGKPQPGGAGGMGGAGIAQGGDRAVEEAPFDFKPEVSKSQNDDNGRTLARSFIKDDSPDKGEAKAEVMRGVIRSNLQQSSDEVDSQRIGRQAQKSVRDYFKTIAGLNDATAAPSDAPTGGQANEPAPK